MTEEIPYPHILRRGELIRKVVIVTFEFADGDLRQAAYLSRRRADGDFSCCYHIGRLEGGVFFPEAADCLEQVSAEDVDLRLEAVLTGIRASLEGKFVSHNIYDLTSLPTLEEQLDFLAQRRLAHFARALPA